jgi:hypothetical protein
MFRVVSSLFTQALDQPPDIECYMVGEIEHKSQKKKHDIKIKNTISSLHFFRRMTETTGVNFTNVLRAAFAPTVLRQ